MSPLSIALVALVVTFAAGLLGLAFKPSETHASDRSRDAVRLIQALIASIAALVLSLLIASSSDHFRQQASAVTLLASKAVVLDRVLVEYGPEAAEARRSLRGSAEQIIAKVWGEASTEIGSLEIGSLTTMPVFETIIRLDPDDTRRKFLHGQALRLVMDVAEARALLFSREDMSAIQGPTLVVLIGWFALLFLATGLFTEVNATVVIAMLAGALAVSGALFLVLEQDRPFEGIMRVSYLPIADALRAMPAP